MRRFKMILSAVLTVSLLVSFSACAERTVSPQDEPPAPTVPGRPEDETMKVTAVPDDDTSAATPKVQPGAETAAEQTAAPTEAPDAEPTVEPPPLELSNAEEISQTASGDLGVKREPDDRFVAAQMQFSLSLFQNIVKRSGKSENTVLSPLSVSLALAMAANGADGKTREEIERVFGGLSIQELNEYLNGFVSLLSTDPDCRFHSANSVWYNKSGIQVKKDFLQTAADYYGASAFQAEFAPKLTKEINEWASDHTDGKIRQILNEINPEALMYLLNAISFDAEWSKIYTKESVNDKLFFSANGENRTVSMMASLETKYLEDGKATGFLKSYKGNQYSFAVLLPNEDIDIQTYIESLTPETLLKTLSKPQRYDVTAELPKFTCESAGTAGSLKEILSDMGMPDAFQRSANFSKMGTPKDGDSLCLSDVIHKAVLSVGELGTSAAAVTVIEAPGSGMPVERKSVILDRPFVFAVIDNETHLPIFIGAVMDIT